MIEAMGEGVDTELEGFEADGRSLTPRNWYRHEPSARSTWPLSGAARRQDEEAQVALWALVLELGPELRPAIDLDALDAEGDLGDELEEGCGAARGCAAGDEGRRSNSPRVVSREVLDRLVGATLTKRVSIWTSSPGLIGFMP